jgi:hypothetical protein
VTNNGEEPSWVYCSYDASHKFLTQDARMSHEPSCPSNPQRTSERENPER